MAIVVAIYVFVGNSGVLSFGHISFVAVGAFTAGRADGAARPEAGRAADRLPAAARPHGRKRDLAGARGAPSAASSRSLVGLPLMRLSGLAAGIATFAVLEITHNVLSQWDEIGPGLDDALAACPRRPGPLQATIGALIVIAVAFGYQRSRLGRVLRASARGPGGGARDRRRACTASGSGRSRSRARWPGFAGGLLRPLPRLRSTTDKSTST